MDNDLDDLISEALANRPAAPRATRKRILPEDLGSARALFADADAENWERTRGLALVHEESGTLLGNFSEYIHRSIPGARKLLREVAPIAVSGTERVSGSWWLGEGRVIETRKAWHEKRPAILHLHLSELKVHAPAVEVCVHLSYGGIARCELTLDTMFRCEEGEGLLFLPAETNVLEVMSLDSKLALRKECGL